MYGVLRLLLSIYMKVPMFKVIVHVQWLIADNNTNSRYTVNQIIDKIEVCQRYLEQMGGFEFTKIFVYNYIKIFIKYSA